jgi:hypothetical protein
VPIKLPDDNTFLKKVYENENVEILKEQFHTTYHEIEKLTTSMIIKW